MGRHLRRALEAAFPVAHVVGTIIVGIVSGAVATLVQVPWPAACAFGFAIFLAGLAVGRVITRSDLERLMSRAKA